MSDKPSIAELQQLNGIVCDGSRPDHITHAAQAVLARWQPVLLEIVATGLVWAEAEDALARADSSTARVAAAMRATAAFDKHRTALAKVRP